MGGKIDLVGDRYYIDHIFLSCTLWSVFPSGYLVLSVCEEAIYHHIRVVCFASLLVIVTLMINLTMHEHWIYTRH